MRASTPSQAQRDHTNSHNHNHNHNHNHICRTKHNPNDKAREGGYQTKLTSSSYIEQQQSTALTH